MMTAPTPPPVYLAADGGQSRLKMAVAERAGDEALVGASTAVPGFAWGAGIDPAAAQHDAIIRAWRELGSPGPVETLACGLSGLTVPSPEADRLLELLADTLGARRVIVAGDDVTVHAGALGGRPGVVLNAGTGVVATSLDATGRRVSIDGLGYLLGDAGGGSWLGREGLRAALAGWEGRHARTELTDRALERFGDLREFVHDVLRSPTMVADVASFAREVLDAATGGDQVAVALCDNATDELAATTAAALRHGHPAAVAATVPFAWTGSILTTTELIRGPLLTRLATACPQLVPEPPAGGSLEGAAALATGTAAAHLTLVCQRQAG